MSRMTDAGGKGRRTNRWLMPVLLVGATLFVAGNAYMALSSVGALTRADNLVEHTYQVIAQVERVLSSAKDAETGSRGYLLTGQDRYLEPYRRALAQLPMQLDEFGRLVPDNESQQMRLQGMREVLQRRLALLQQANALRTPSGDLDTVQAMQLMGDGKVEMDRMRAIANWMEEEEMRLLSDRQKEAAMRARRVQWTIVLASVLDFLLIAFVARFLVRERELRLVETQTARELAASRVEIVRKAEEISALNESLEEKVRLRTAELAATNKELEAFSYSVSHDLRAPLRTIDGFSLALEEDYGEIVGPEGKDYIQRVRAGVQRMGGLIDALLQLSRITRADVTRENVDLSAMAESIAGQIVEQNPGQTIRFSIQPGLRADADPKLVRVALENLFGNAAKFSSKKPESRINFFWDAGKMAWCVEDNGAGFDMHYRDKLFGAFNRLHGDKDFKGSGIGLATVARVVRRHHGKIWAESEEGHGAAFWFTLG